MKNPFKNNSKSGIVIAGLAISAVVAGALKYFYAGNKHEIDGLTGELKDNTKDYLQKRARNRTRSGLKGL
jgi:hypothetical protein